MKKLLFLFLMFAAVAVMAQTNLIPQRYTTGKWGFIDSASGKWVIEPKYDKVALFSEGLAGVRYAGQCGYIDTNGKMIVQPRYDDCYMFDQGYAYVQESGKLGVINKKGKLVIPCEYDMLEDFNGYSFRYERDGKSGEVSLPIEQILKTD